MLIQDPFDIAPAAQRYTPAAWLLLAVAFGFAAVASTQLLHACEQASAAQDELQQIQRTLRRQEKKAAEAADLAREPGDLVRARLQLQRVLNVSWSGLFELLEGATKLVDGRVTLSSLAPVRLRPEGAEIGITGLAASSDAMLQYLKFLDAHPQVLQVQLVSRQAETLNGAAVLRFQAKVLVDRSMGSIARASIAAGRHE